MQEETAFKLVQKGNQTSIRIQSLSEEVFDVLDGGRASADAAIGQFIVSRLFQSGNSCKLRKIALKAARKFQKMQLNNYNGLTRTSELNEISKQIDRYETIVKIAKKLNLPIKVLVENDALVSFICNNHLHYRIDKSYIERAFGPRMIDGQVLFPLNTGSSFNSKNVRWVSHTEIPVNKSGKVQYTYGPFGFESYHCETSAEIRPIKLQKRAGNVTSSSIRLELVTSVPNYNPFKILKGSLGHGWIRVYQPELDERGKDTGRDFVYSIGYFLRGSLKTPDPTEFVPGIKLVTTQKEIPQETWDELKILIEDIQRNLQGEKIENEEAILVTQQIKGGSCCNFSTEIFRRGTGQKFDGRFWGVRHLRFISQPIGSVLKNVVPAFVTKWGSRLQNGVFPGALISEQQACTIV